jgi:nucleoside-diphosphate-sugar epimerase
MKVLLTGANGLVGSHILDVLRAHDTSVVLLLRARSDRRFIQSHLGHDQVEIREGGLDDAASLDRALVGVTHVIHCAGATKALRRRDFFAINQLGTRHLVAAINRHGGIQRLVHFSSLAAAGPSSRLAPLSEGAPAQPVSIYGHSKLAGEEEVTTGCKADYTILRPPAVYGPRDREFLRLFKVIRLGIKPVFGTGVQELSFVYVEDLAGAAVHCLTSPVASRRTFFVAERGIFTVRQFADRIAEALGRNAFLLRLPGGLLYVFGVAQDVLSTITRRPNVLSRRKYPELSAEAWTCDGSRLQIETGYICRTGLAEGVARTRDWYRRERWL